MCIGRLSVYTLAIQYIRLHKFIHMRVYFICIKSCKYIYIYIGLYSDPSDPLSACGLPLQLGSSSSRNIHYSTVLCNIAGTP